MRRRPGFTGRRARSTLRTVRRPETGQTFREIAIGLAAVVVGVVVVAGAYTLLVGRDDDDVPADFRSAARRAATSVVLKQEDLPAGWTLADTAEGRGFGIELSDDCQVLEAGEVQGSAGYALADQHRGPNGQSVITDAAVFQSLAKASEALDEYVAALSRCDDELVDAIEARVVEEAAAAGQGSARAPVIAMQVLPEPDLGDRALAYRITVSPGSDGAPAQATLDVIAVLTGRIVCGLTYRAGAVDETELLRLASALTFKGARANGTLAPE